MILALTGCNNTAQQDTTGATWPSFTVPETTVPAETVHVHEFSEATCTSPMICSCGTIEGAPLGHDYADGVCFRCGAVPSNSDNNNDFVGDFGGGNSGSNQTGSNQTGSNQAGSNQTGSSASLPDMLSQEQIDNFPIKTSNMSVLEMRDLCVSFFRFSKSVLWISTDTVEIPLNYNATSWETMPGGVLYGGLPYVGNTGNGNVYRMMDYYDPSTGKLDIQRAMGNYPGLFGNHCSGAAYWGWARVVNSAKYAFTENMTHARGFLRVGPYTYDDSHTGFNKNFRTKTICTDNGKDTMFESYALVKPADGLVQYGTAGHVIMVSADPVVVRNVDGSINANQSYLYVIEQTSGWVNNTNENGKEYNAKGYLDKKYAFATLFSSGYIPFTFAEFLGTDPVEKTQCSSTLSGSSVTLDQIFSSSVKSNYAISDVYVLISDGSGVVQKTMVKATAVHTMKLNLRNSGNNVDVWGKTDLGSGSYSVEIQAQLGTGERITVYSGKLAN